MVWRGATALLLGAFVGVCFEWFADGFRVVLMVWCEFVFSDFGGLVGFGIRRFWICVCCWL